MLTEIDVHIMQQHFDAIEDTASAMIKRAAWDGDGTKPPAADKVLDEALMHFEGHRTSELDKHGERLPCELWHRCMSLAYDIAHARGELRFRGRASRRLDRDTVCKIYAEAHAAEETQSEIARRYMVSPKTISDIKLRNKYARFTDPNYTPHIPNSKLTSDDACEIFRLAHEGELTQRVIAERYGISPKTVSSIKRGILHANATKQLMSSDKDKP